MTEENIQQKLEKLNQEIRAITTKLKNLNDKKEKTYSEKDEVDKQLNSYIKSAQDLRDKKKEMDTAIRELKTKRDVFNNNLKVLWDTFNEKKKQILGKQSKEKAHISPGAIRSKIEHLEKAIETEIVDFEKEQKAMTQIKLLKAQLAALAAEDSQFKEIKDMREQIKTKKKEADDFHIKIQSLAKASTDVFNNLTKHSEDIASAKETRKKMQIAIKKTKTDIEKLSKDLSDQLKEWSTCSKDAPPVVPISHPTEDIMDTLKGKKKLTKDDLLAMQRRSMRK